MFQNPFGVPSRTVLDHVSLPAVARGASRCEADRHAHGLLERFELADQGRQPFATLSGGEAQHLMLARAVASEPALILVDEPTAQLDATSAATVIEVLDGLAAHGASVIIATHDTRVPQRLPQTCSTSDPGRRSGRATGRHPCPMRAREMGREAVRDILSGGTAKATLLTCIFLALVGGLAIADARVLVNTMDEAARWRAGGGAIVIMNAPGRIDGAACAALRDTAGIRASGAIRPSPTSLSTPAMPSTAVTTWEVTPGLPAVVTTAPATPGETGLWLSEALAQDLNRYHGATLATTGPAPVAGTFPMPEEDGRLPTLAYAILAPVRIRSRRIST